MLLQSMTIEDVRQCLKVSWGTIKEIDKEYLLRHFDRPRLKEVRYLAIDEFAVQKGHKYKTVVMDLETGQVIFVGDGRAEATLAPFARSLKASGAHIEAIAMDMWPAYISWTIKHFPDVSIVFDRFHIVKNLNEAISDVRKALYRQETELNKRKLLKGTRWLLLKNQDNLSEEKDEPKRLQQALEINQPLAAAYYLKEELKQLWLQPTVEAAKQFLGKWVARAIATKLPRMRKFANLLLAHRSGIFNWFDHLISTGPLEGLNNKIKVLKRKAYGYRDMEYFDLKIKALHTNRYALL